MSTMGSRGMWVCVGFLAIAGFFLLTEHRAHSFGALPLLFLLVCPLLHLMSHGRNNGHRGPGRGHNHSAMPGKGRTP